MTKRIIILVSVGVIALGATIGPKINWSYFSYEPELSLPIDEIHDSITLSIGEKDFDAMVSWSEKLRARGLAGYTSLSDGEAMLFTFPDEALWGIWMKDMLFSIDIIWLDRELKIVSIEKSVSPETYPETFFPKEKALYVIELKAGVADGIGAKIGDKVFFVGAPPVGK